MPFVEQLLNIMRYEISEAPEMGSAFHLVFCLLAVALTLALTLKQRDASDRTFRKIVAIAWSVMVVLEIYREATYSFSIGDGGIVYDYAWWQFPFQLCATPLYVYPLIFLLKDCPLRTAAVTYAATFAMFGGLAVMVYPGDVMTALIGVSVQSMIHHGLQVVIGIYCAVYYRKRLTHEAFLSAIGVFSVLASLALTLNIATYHLFPVFGVNDTVNLFFISPYYPCTLPVLSTVYAQAPYPVFLAIYIFGFAAVASLFFYLYKGLMAITVRVKASCHAK